MTWHKRSQLSMTSLRLTHFEDKMREKLRSRRNLGWQIEGLLLLLRGWVNYFRLTEVKEMFEALDSWLRRKLRCILWRQ